MYHYFHKIICSISFFSDTSHPSPSIYWYCRWSILLLYTYMKTILFYNNTDFLFLPFQHFPLYHPFPSAFIYFQVYSTIKNNNNHGHQHNSNPPIFFILIQHSLSLKTSLISNWFIQPRNLGFLSLLHLSNYRDVLF